MTYNFDTLYQQWVDRNLEFNSNDLLTKDYFVEQTMSYVDTMISEGQDPDPVHLWIIENRPNLTDSLNDSTDNQVFI